MAFVLRFAFVSAVLTPLWLGGCGAEGAFDTRGLKTIPAVDIAELATFGDRQNLADVGASVDAETRRVGIERTLAVINAETPKVRGLFWLVYCANALGDGSDNTHQVLHFFFALWGGNYAPQIEDALKQAGFADRAQVFAQAMALFGKPYPLDWQARYRLYGWSSPSKDANAFDARMIALGHDFGSQADFKQAINAYIDKDAELTAWCDKARGALTDRQRLINLMTRLDALEGSRKPSVFLKWPEPYRTLQILEIGLLELVNGGAEQFFVNFSGDTAPEAVVAYRTIGLPEAADAVAKGIGYFPPPYPRLSSARLEAEQHDAQLSAKLDALTDAIRAETSAKMIEHAKREGVLPR